MERKAADMLRYIGLSLTTEQGDEMLEHGLVGYVVEDLQRRLACLHLAIVAHNHRLDDIAFDESLEIVAGAGILLVYAILWIRKHKPFSTPSPYQRIPPHRMITGEHAEI